MYLGKEGRFVIPSGEYTFGQLTDMTGIVIDENHPVKITCSESAEKLALYAALQYIEFHAPREVYVTIRDALQHKTLPTDTGENKQ